MFTRIAAVLAALTTLAGTATANTVTWNVNGPTSLWNNPQNWVGGHLPTAFDFVVIPTGGSVQVSGATIFVTGMFIQPGANLLIFNSFYCEGGASIQGNMSVVGGRFLHRDDVNLEGQLMLWSGASINRRSAGTGVFTVRPGASILIRSDNTQPVTLATALDVQGLLDDESNQQLMVGQVGADASDGTYIALDAGATARFTRSCQLLATTYAGQSAPYIVNAGEIDVQGPLSNVVDIAANLPLFNGGVVNVDQPDLHIRSSWDFSLDTLIRGAWACQNYGRIFFDGNTLGSVAADVRIFHYGAGSEVVGLEQTSSNYGQITADYGGGVNFLPASQAFNNHGEIMIGDHSIVGVNGTFVNAPDGTIDCWLGGAADNTHGMVTCLTASLAGTLNANVENSYVPSLGDSATLVQASSSITGGFSTVNINYTGIPGTMSYQPLLANLVFGSTCPADLGQQGGIPGADGVLDNNDFIAFIGFFFSNDARADIGQQGGLPGHDGQFDNNDFIAFISLFFAGC